MAINEDLEAYLSDIARAMPRRSGRSYNSIAEIILKEGYAFSTDPYTKEEERAILKAFDSGTRSKIKQCFYNAQSLTINKGLGYAEGYVMSERIAIAIEHAWNYLPSGKIVDLTLREFGEKETCDPKKLLARAKKNLENAYMGVTFHPVDIRASWFRNSSALMLLTDPVILGLALEEGFPRGPSMSGLEDIPMPPDIQRPEMWTTAAIVQAVHDGFDFMIPFVMGEGLFSPNAYWIVGRQAGASGFTVGPDHTPEIGLIEPDDWIRAKTFFQPEMVPEKAWLEPPNENGVVPVYVEIDPETIDWELLNRGRQIRVRRGL